MCLGPLCCHTWGPLEDSAPLPCLPGETLPLQALVYPSPPGRSRSRPGGREAGPEPPRAPPRATAGLRSWPEGPSRWDRHGISPRAKGLPAPPDLEASPSALRPQEWTHSVGGTVGSMFILRRLVPLVGGDPVVHEPGRRGTFLGAGPGLCPWGWEERASASPPLLLSLLPFDLSNLLCPIPCGYRTWLNSGAPHSHFLLSSFTVADIQYSSLGHSVTNFYIRTRGPHPGRASAHSPSLRRCLPPLPRGYLPPRKPPSPL